jgi:hypothetical protein
MRITVGDWLRLWSTCEARWDSETMCRSCDCESVEKSQAEDFPHRGSLYLKKHMSPGTQLPF